MLVYNLNCNIRNSFYTVLSDGSVSIHKCTLTILLVKSLTYTRIFGFSQILEFHPGQVSQKFWYSLIFQSVQYAIIFLVIRTPYNKTRVHITHFPCRIRSLINSEWPQKTNIYNMLSIDYIMLASDTKKERRGKRRRREKIAPSRMEP